MNYYYNLEDSSDLFVNYVGNEQKKIGLNLLKTLFLSYVRNVLTDWNKSYPINLIFLGSGMCYAEIYLLLVLKSLGYKLNNIIFLDIEYYNNENVENINQKLKNYNVDGKKYIFLKDYRELLQFITIMNESYKQYQNDNKSHLFKTDYGKFLMISINFEMTLYNDFENLSEDDKNKLIYKMKDEMNNIFRKIHKIDSNRIFLNEIADFNYNVMINGLYRCTSKLNLSKFIGYTYRDFNTIKITNNKIEDFSQVKDVSLSDDYIVNDQYKYYSIYNNYLNDVIRHLLESNDIKYIFINKLNGNPFSLSSNIKNKTKIISNNRVTPNILKSLKNKVIVCINYVLHSDVGESIIHDVIRHKKIPVDIHTFLFVVVNKHFHGVYYKRNHLEKKPNESSLYDKLQYNYNDLKK